MKLEFYHWKDDAAALFGVMTPDETDHPLLAEVPPVFRENGERLHPADGEEFLRAVHEEMRDGSGCWTEVEE